MNKLAVIILEETTWGTAKCTCLPTKKWKVKYKQKVIKTIDPPEVRNEDFAGTRLLSAAAVARMREV